MDPRDINLFREGDIVDIVGIPDMQKLRIDRITDGGVSVVGGNLTPYTVISGRSPAVPHVAKAVIIDGVEQPAEPIVERASRGQYAEAMKNMQTPENRGTFTIKNLAEINKIPIPYALGWVKENCIEAGEAPRVEGQRGKSAMLYKVKI